MEFGFSEEQERFREEIVSFIKKEVPSTINDEVEGAEALSFARRFARQLGEKSWLTIGWPKEYGGGGRGKIESAILEEELNYHKAAFPSTCHMGIQLLGPALMQFGTEQQRQRILPAISSGELVISMSLTEPNGGSDLAALKTRAVRVGDHYIVNGQKVYQTDAHLSDMNFFLVRTDPDAPRHGGMSILLIDLKAPGVTIRPLHCMDGRRLNEIFLDDVRVPKENLIGNENMGFQHMATALAFERGNMKYVGKYRRLFDDFVQFCKETTYGAKPLAADPVVQQKLAHLATEIEVWRVLAWRMIWMTAQNVVPTYEASAQQLYVKRCDRLLGEAAMDILGRYALLASDSKFAAMKGRIGRHYLGTFGLSRAATPEILKNVMAIRGLRLPR